MTFYEVLAQVMTLLQRHGRVSYRALKRQFDLDDAYVEDLKAELVEVHGLARDQDGTMLVWVGYPQAHEDSARRAVRSGLEIIEAMRSLNTRLTQEKGLRLAVRVGIHTGLVVVGDVGGGARHERLALGETPNIAARLHSLAAPDTVIISRATQRLVQGYFVCQDLEQQVLRGVTAPIQVYRVLQVSGAQSSLEVVTIRGLTPLVGREQEVGLLLERWERVKESLGQVVFLSGEAGIGKSRLVEVLKAHLLDEPATCIEGRCSPYQPRFQCSS